MSPLVSDNVVGIELRTIVCGRAIPPCVWARNIWISAYEQHAFHDVVESIIGISVEARLIEVVCLTSHYVEIVDWICTSRAGSWARCKRITFLTHDGQWIVCLKINLARQS